MLKTSSSAKFSNAPIINGETQTPQACIIWLHGLGADASDFASIPGQLGLPASHKIKFIFPNAPVIPVTVNGGYMMPAWYDILELTEERVIREEDLKASVDYVHQLIEQTLDEGVDAGNILLVGFSQGGAVVYHAALSFPKRLAGIIGLSTYYPQTDLISPHKENAHQDILICHGRQDPMVLERQGKKTADLLASQAHKVEYKLYNMDHSVCISEVRDIAHFIKERLGSTWQA